MKTLIRSALGLAVVAGMTAVAAAQVDAAAAAGTAANVAGAAGGAGRVVTIWDKLGCSWEAKDECKRRLCALPIGQLFNNMLLPMGAMTGGILGPCCPPVDPKKLVANDPDKKGGVEEAAAKMKKEEAEAKARAAAIRYMATADCERWPEARATIVKALLTDTNQCVRLAAAQALGTGCCCNKETILALKISAAGEDAATAALNKLPAPKEGEVDEYPTLRELATKIKREKCERVRLAARASLDHCLCCFVERVTPPEKKQQGPVEKSGDKAAMVYGHDLQQVGYVTTTGGVTPVNSMEGVHGSRLMSNAPPAGQRSLLGIFSRASQATTTPVVRTEPVVTRQPYTQPVTVRSTTDETNTGTATFGERIRSLFSNGSR
jgi:hypothetical protein